MKTSHFRTPVVSLTLSFSLLLLAAPTSLFGQASSSAGRLEGRVTDVSGALVPGASVTARNTATGITSKLSSDSQGHFEFVTLAPGNYEVSIAAPGFSDSVAKSVAIRVGTTATLDPMLAVGGDQTQITVSAEDLIDTQQSSLATVVDRENINNLPLNGRNFTDFALLTPGATTDGEGMISFNGQAGNFNNYSVDGANNNNAFFAQQMGRTSIPFQFSEDVIQEFQVTSSGFEAEFGQAGGGLVNTITRSGTNNFHGDTYYYLLDSALNANDPINKQLGIVKPADRRQQFGATVDGPLRHNGIFYLFNYEGQLRNEPITVNKSAAIANLPVDFFAANPGIADDVNAASGSFARSFNQNVLFGKVTALLNSRNSLDVSYNYERYRSPHGYVPSPTSSGDGLSLTDGATTHFFQASLHTTFSPKTANELRLHFGDDYHFDLPDTPPTTPSVVINNPDTGFAFGGNRFQLSTSDHRYEISDNLTRVAGRHTLKFGGDFNYNRDLDYFVYGPHGEYQFRSLADIPTGNFQFYLQSFGKDTVPVHSPTYSLFAQDEFRLTPRLTLNYGVRYDLQVLPQPSTCNPDLPLTCHIHYSKGNVAPRLGFAWTPFKDNKTVVRGAFGMFYEQENLLDVSEALVSNGISRQFLFVAGPAFGVSNPIVKYPNSLTSIPAGAADSQSAKVFAANFRSPYVEQGSLGIDHQFGTNTALSVSYAYTHGLALLGNSNGVTRQANGAFGNDINLIAPDQQVAAGGSYATDTINLPNGKTYTVPEYEAIEGAINQNFGAINVYDNTGHSKYNALLVSLRHTSKRYFAIASYTLSKSTDQGTSYFNQFDVKNQRGLSALDQRHRLAASGGWTPTTGFFHDFVMSGVLIAATGRPYTGTLDTSLINFSLVPGQGINTFKGPNTVDFDLSVSRQIQLSERYSLRLRAESFNLFNHANYLDGSVNNVQFTTAADPSQPDVGNAYVAAANPNFGKPLQSFPKDAARSFQFSARLSF